MDPFFYPIILAGAVAGAGCGLLGVYIVGLRVPFMGICISHAAMAGVVFSLLLGFDSVLAPIVFSILASLPLACIRPGKSGMDPNVALSILFSIMLGLTFIGIGLLQSSRSEALQLLWGSILFVRGKSLCVITAVAGLFILFAAAFNKELKVLLFSRSIAAATGVHETFVYCLFLALSSMVLAVNLPIVGGLMVFGLLTNPAAAAYLICRGHRSVVVFSTIFGVISAVGGLLFSYLLNLPTGACIVIFSAVIFALSAAYRAFRGPSISD